MAKCPCIFKSSEIARNVLPALNSNVKVKSSKQMNKSKMIKGSVFVEPITVDVMCILCYCVTHPSCENTVDVGLVLSYCLKTTVS